MRIIPNDIMRIIPNDIVTTLLRSLPLILDNMDKEAVCTKVRAYAMR